MSKFTGSIDTGAKLGRLREYLQAYSIALGSEGFERIYIDAFAGTGLRTETRAALPLLGPEFAEPEQVDTPGSAQIALSIEPPFQAFALIEKDKARYAQLKRLKERHPDRNIALKNGDANLWVRQLCEKVPWHRKQAGIKGMRGVIFLDPYGMEVDWQTVEAIAATNALDCRYFFPLSGLYRNAPHDPAKREAGKDARLDRVLGATDWRQRWYEHSVAKSDMFETETDAVRRADVDAIEAFVKERLETVFKGGVLAPYRLRHNNNAPMASLFFAVSNPSPAAVGLAMRIASHILSSGNSS